jgi:hypothetical protein
MIRSRLVFTIATTFIVAFASPARAEPGSAPAQTSTVSRQSSTPYYIEFRVATIGTYGHSYVAYGRLNAQVGCAAAQVGAEELMFARRLIGRIMDLQKVF